MMPHRIRTVLLIALGLAVIVGIVLVLWFTSPAEVPEGFITGNGRIEATEINVSTKIAGRIEEILVDEGDFVKAGMPLVRMQTDVLEAQLAEAVALLQEAQQAVATAWSQLAMRESDLAAARAVIAQRESELNFARRNLDRLITASERDAVTTQELDQQRTRTLVAEAALTSAQAQATAMEAAIEAAHAGITSAQWMVNAREATVARVEADIRDSVLTSPRDGRVQYRIAQPGEVLAAGGRVLNVIDLSDVYMTFFLPTRAAGRLAIGTEVRIILDAAPQDVIPAEVSFVSSTAQFTPKAVETTEEREKLMFRVRARISPDLLRRHLEQVKTGLPGIAWVRLDENIPWPESLTIRLPE